MAKIILEYDDLEKIIKQNFPQMNGMEGLAKDTQIIIDIGDVPIKTENQNIVRTQKGTIDADKSGLKLVPPKSTTPGGRMGIQRGSLPVY